MVNHKGLTWQDSWGQSCLLHPRPDTQTVLWRGLRSKTQDPMTGHVSLHICILCLGASIWRFLYQGNIKIIFSPLRFSTQYFPIPSLCLCPSSQIKSLEVFLSFFSLKISLYFHFCFVALNGCSHTWLPSSFQLSGAPDKEWFKTVQLSEVPKDYI